MREQEAKVVVVGSFNMDVVIKAERRPRKGETLIGQEFGMFSGGKGFNQATAAARLGADVVIIGRLGKDTFGDILMSASTEEKIDTNFVVRDAEVGTGVATIVIDAAGDNSIILVPHANMRLSVEDVQRRQAMLSAVLSRPLWHKVK